MNQLMLRPTALRIRAVRRLKPIAATHESRETAKAFRTIPREGLSESIKREGVKEILIQSFYNIIPD